MNVNVQGATEGKYMLNVTAAILLNFVHSCPRHVASKGIGEPAGDDRAGMTHQPLESQRTRKGPERSFISWSYSQGKQGYQRQWRAKDYACTVVPDTKPDRAEGGHPATTLLARFVSIRGSEGETKPMDPELHSRYLAGLF